MAIIWPCTCIYASHFGMRVIQMSGSTRISSITLDGLNQKGFHPEKNLTPPDILSSDEVWSQYHLTNQQILTKRLALQAHKSQYSFSQVSFVFCKI